MADTIREEQPRIKTEIKIGNTTYIVGGYFASKGVTVSEKNSKLLDKETKTINAGVKFPEVMLIAARSLPLFYRIVGLPLFISCISQFVKGG